MRLDHACEVEASPKAPTRVAYLIVHDCQPPFFKSKRQILIVLQQVTQFQVDDKDKD